MTSNSWHSYASSFPYGHKAIDALWTVPLYCEEKVDGSQFSFGRFVQSQCNNCGKWEGLCVCGSQGWTAVETIRMKSRGAEIYPEAPPAMFGLAAKTVMDLREQLVAGWTYRGEVLAKPKHNALAYDRVPKGNVILFDVSTGEGSSLSRAALVTEAERLGLEVVPLLGFIVPGDNTALKLRGMLAADSVLGGQKIEGVACKQINPTLYGPDKKVLMCKYVSENFKEVHKQTWGESNPSSGDAITRIAKEFCTPARWQKAIQHLSERPEGLTNSVRDIGPLIKEIPLDVQKECEQEIKDRLFEHFWPHIRRMVTYGFPEWYKTKINEQNLTREIEADGQTVQSEVAEGPEGQPV